MPTPTQSTAIYLDWMACSSIAGDTGLLDQPQLGMIIVNAPNSPYAEGSTPIYTGQIRDVFGAGIPATAFSSLTLSIVSTLTGEVINGVDAVDILNTGRGTIDSSGNLTIQLESGDTSLSTFPGQARVQYSMIIDWTYETVVAPTSSGSGRHQVNFSVLALAGP